MNSTSLCLAFFSATPPINDCYRGDRWRVCNTVRIPRTPSIVKSHFRLAYSAERRDHSSRLGERDEAATLRGVLGLHDTPTNRHEFQCGSIATPDSVFREPMPGEHLTLPNPSAPTGEYLLDKDIIDRVAELRTFIEDLEVNRGKQSQLKLMERELNKDKCEIVHLTEEESARLAEEERRNPPTPAEAEEPLDPGEPIEINDTTLEPITEHMYEENMLEEVLGKAMSVYRKNRDQASIQRLEGIVSEIAPIAEKVRKQRAEEIIMRMINCCINEEEDLNDVLEELHKKKQLNKYLMQRFDELIKLSSQRFRISDKHPAVSEHFLRTLKDRAAAQVITAVRGTDQWVRILAECFRYDSCADFETVLRKHLRKIEDIEDFCFWLRGGIEYCREKGRMENRIHTMETVESIAEQLHPVWNPVDDHIETEERPYDQPISFDEVMPG